MLQDASFRILLMNAAWKDLQQKFHKSDFTPSQRDVIQSLVHYINEIGRIVMKEEGAIVKSL